MSEGRAESGKRPPLRDDPVVEEVRAARRKLWQAAGRDLHRFVDAARERDELRRAAPPGGTHEAE